MDSPLHRALGALSLCAVFAGCLVPLEEPGDDGGHRRASHDAGARVNPLRPDASLRPPDGPDAAVSVVTDAGGPGGMDAGRPDSGDAGGPGGMDAGRPDSAVPVSFDAGGPAGPWCSTWQDCGPHYNDPNNAYECRNNACVCDPDGQWEPTCTNMGAYFSAFDCFCVMEGGAPPGEDPNPDDNCGWEWEYECARDTWRDTSHYERRCETINGQTECRDVWVESGYWENGSCSNVRWVWKCR